MLNGKKKTIWKLHGRDLENCRARLPYLLSPFSVFSMFKMSRILYKNHLSMEVSFVISSRDMLSSRACQKEKTYFLGKYFINVLCDWKQIAAIPLHVIQRAWGYRPSHETWNWYHIIDVAPNKTTDAVNYIQNGIQRRCPELIREVNAQKIPLKGFASCYLYDQLPIIP